MKKIFSILVALLMNCGVFSQKTIDKPDYGLSNLPGKLTKIELTDSATIIHFYIKYQPGQWIQVPKDTYIQDINGGVKYLATQTEGIPFGERYTMPETGEANYKVFFPKLKNGIDKIDFGEGNNNPNNWSVYDIVLNEKDVESLLPKVLQGNWFQTDGSNQWDYGFYANQAVVDKAVWNYKTVSQKKNNYSIVLERNGNLKTVYVQIDKKGAVKIGDNKEKLAVYSKEKTENPNYKLANDEIFSSNIFKSDSATFSGFIKGYTARAGRKTGKVYVSNALTGSQDTYIVEIANDGSFKVQFPINHPMSVFVQIPGANSTVFVEPGKETFQLIDVDAVLFMGDCAGINTDLKALEKAESYKDYQKLRKTILEMSPEAFKQACLEIKEKQLQELDVISQKQFVSQKALQIKKLDIEFLAFAQILTYQTYRQIAQSDKAANKVATSDEDYKIEASYYDFITKSMLNNEAVVIANNFSYFASNLANVEALNEHPVLPSFRTMSDMAKTLQDNGIVLTNEELEMIGAFGKLEKGNLRLLDFNTTNKTKIADFNNNHKEAYEALQKNKLQNDISVGDFAAYLKTQGVSLTAEEKELVSNYKLIQLSKEELVVKKAFEQKYAKKPEEFGKKYMKDIQNIISGLYSNKSYNKMKEVYGLKETFLIDAMLLQQKARMLENNFTPYTESELQTIQKNIKHPFLSNYIVFENDKLKARLEANKSKTGFAVNTVQKATGDELFNSMIAKFKGKVIYVDFWATWCGPCKSGIKEIAPLKEEMKSKDVVFLYITGQSSPEKTWSNSIPDIKGEHYRVSEDEWKYLTKKFNVTGIPHYVLVNKKGEVVNPELGHHSNEGLKKILEKQM
ncbi:TlpA family protein disulfide reductase [Flavobacterium sufflavum]|uniref:TlpA family protein disulfide reductase n=1 Tax=Flavobacterium sufflavum TaxID=1921138 RepID=A0A3S2XF83_9FLAO|nr:TlpA disulfide reductase family protein [Flavobacterium sufflavum]RVT77544.1 TlpA family protein disulfide reductase [Flavobacterium sufflavum]